MLKGTNAYSVLEQLNANKGDALEEDHINSRSYSPPGVLNLYCPEYDSLPISSAAEHDEISTDRKRITL